jgi:hypothetical protein
MDDATQRRRVAQRSQSRQLQMILAHAASFPRFLMVGLELMLATDCLERIGSDAIQWVNAGFATRRRQFKHRSCQVRTYFM